MAKKNRVPSTVAIGIEIMEIIDRWLSPDRRYFRVQAYDGRVYILRDDKAGEWEPTLFGQHP